MNKGIDYKYNEDELLAEITQYIDDTYGGHYSQNKYQATEFIIDGGHGEGFCIGNVMKYAQRYGHKGKPEDWRRDLMKVIHYAIIAMYNHDRQYNFPTALGEAHQATDGLGKKKKYRYRNTKNPHTHGPHVQQGYDYQTPLCDTESYSVDAIKVDGEYN